MSDRWSWNSDWQRGWNGENDWQYSHYNQQYNQQWSSSSGESWQQSSADLRAELPFANEGRNTAPRTPPSQPNSKAYESRARQWDLASSPTGGKSGVMSDLPKDFQPDEFHYDKNEKFKRKFPKTIAHTPWSSRNNLAGRDPFQIPVSELCYMGKSNASLRWLACGEFMTLVMARSMNEAVLMEKFLKLNRTAGLDLMQVGSQIFQELHPDRTPDLDTNAGKADIMQAIATKLHQTLVPYVKNDLQIAQQKVKSLQNELQRVKQGQASPASASQPKRRRLVGKAPNDQSLAPFDVDMVPNKQPLKQTSPKTVTPTAVKKWIEGLELSVDKKKSLEQQCNKITDLHSTLSDAQKNNLANRAVELGLPVDLASKAKQPELMKIILAASSLEI
ncbi:unnamed protein product [Symbiodinium natans]|uniref:Uncharacterized protein n=1 Tax=Symbiodinium natans TaxID=878477 RepID=A0A812LQU1_9DINO|nr:unnamed protein product [Symbiodinium natans]